MWPVAHPLGCQVRKDSATEGMSQCLLCLPPEPHSTGSGEAAEVKAEIYSCPQQ